MIILLTFSLFLSGVLSNSMSTSDIFRANSPDHKHLTKNEFAHIFLAFDRNGDRHVTLTEFEHGWSHRHMKDPSTAGFFFTIADENDDLRVTRADMDYYFTLMDSSADNVLSTHEFNAGWGSLFEISGGDNDGDHDGDD